MRMQMKRINGGAADDMSNKRRRNVNVAVDDQEQQQTVVYKKARITSSSTSSAASACGASAVPAIESGVEIDAGRDAHWTSLPDETVLGLFNLLNHRDRASLASVCKAWQVLGSSPSLWNSLDLRSHTLNSEMVSALAGRCSNLEALKFRRGAFASSIVGLQAKGLRELSGDCCSQLSDATLSMVVARHGNLESLLLGSDCERVTSEALKVVAVCCPKLRRLCVSGVREVDRDAIQALFQHCKGLTELGFLDSHTIDEGAFGGASSLRFLSVAGCRCIVWSTAAHCWSKLPNLAGLDVSRTDITPSSLTQVLAGPELRVVCALNCPVLEEGSNPVPLPSSKTTVVLARFTDVMEGLDALLSPSSWKEEAGSCARSRCGGRARVDSEVAKWTEWMLSHALLKIAECNAPSLLKQGIAMMLRLVQSAQEDVQERAASALATFVVVDDENATVDSARAEAVMNGGGIALLLGLAKSCREGVQSEAAKAIANLSVNTEVAKRVALEGGISVLAALARSRNRWVAEEAAGGLWNLSVGEEHKGAIAGAGAIEALVGLAFKWPAGGEGVLQERAAGALANLAADDKCSMEVAVAGGVRALVRLARFCNHEGVQEQAARALANLAAHGDSNGNNAAVGREEGALEALVQLTCSNHEGVRQEAAGALWNLSFDDRNREAIAAAGGVEALVALAQGCSSGSQGLQERAAGALWGLSVSEANSIAIGREGGVAPLITLAHSDFEDVHETAVGALWNLVFNPGNALRMVEEEGVPALVHLCSSSRSKMARFMAALALAYMFDGRMDEVAVGLSSVENNGRTVSLEAARKLALRNIDAFVQTFFDPQALTAAASSWAGATLNQVAEAATIQEAGHLRCSVAELGRFVAMLRNGHAVLRACAAFALLQFTMPGGRHALHHAVLLQKVGASRVLRTVAAAATAAMQAKVFARVVLRNLEHHQAESNTVVALS